MQEIGKRKILGSHSETENSTTLQNLQFQLPVTELGRDEGRPGKMAQKGNE